MTFKVTHSLVESTVTLSWGETWGAEEEPDPGELFDLRAAIERSWPGEKVEAKLTRSQLDVSITITGYGMPENLAPFGFAGWVRAWVTGWFVGYLGGDERADRF